MTGKGILQGGNHIKIKLLEKEIEMTKFRTKPIIIKTASTECPKCHSKELRRGEQNLWCNNCGYFPIPFETMPVAKHEWIWDWPWFLADLRDWFYMINTVYIPPFYYYHVRILGLRSLWMIKEQDAPATELMEKEMKFRTKPIVIEAVQLRWDTWNEICDFCGVGKLTDGKPQGCYVDNEGNGRDDYPGNFSGGAQARIGLWFPTKEGLMLGIENDWIIRNTQNELYLCKPDIFEATYEAVVE